MHYALARNMVSQRDAGVGHRHEQLVLALVAPSEGLPFAGVPVRDRQARGCSRLLPGQSRAVCETRYNGRRVRKIPSRDGRGRFVAFATTNAPSWFVFCCDGYRIAGQPLEPVSTSVVPASAPVRQRRLRFRIRRAELENVALMLLFCIVCVCYRLYLEVPNR